MQNLEIDITNTFIKNYELEKYFAETTQHIENLHNKTGQGKDFLGWIDLPAGTSKDLINEINLTAKKLQQMSDVVVVTGIGGSYLGAKAVIDALSNNFNDNKKPLIVYAGHNLCEDYMSELINFLNKHSYSIIVISKSGTTTEPAIAFRILKKHIKNQHPDDYKNRIIAITDKEKGALRQLADKEEYKSFVIPGNVGGRYSVLTPVGLLPVAVAGFDIAKIIEGAKAMQQATNINVETKQNPAALYAIARNILYKQEKHIEIFANYHSKLNSFSEWWKQLFGESEGKENKGIFPASVNFTTDLHSLGQLIQEGKRNIFETVLNIENTKNKITIPASDNNLDKLDYLINKRISTINKNALLGTLKAHIKGNVPNILLKIPELNEYYTGQLIYFFEISCAISGYLSGINPFNQPGVEEYKNNMFKLLGKPI